MHIVERVISIVLVIVSLVCLCAPCFAAGAATLAGIDAFSALVSAYLVAHGLDVVLGSSSGVIDIQNPMQSEESNELYQDLYDRYSEWSNSSVTVDSWWNTYSASVSAVNQDNSIALGFGDTITEYFDRFTNWLLGTELGLERTDSGFAHTGGSFASPIASSGVSGSLPVGTWSFVGYQAFNGRGNIYANPRSGPVLLYFFNSYSQFAVYSTVSGTVVDVRNESGSWTATWTTNSLVDSNIPVYESYASWGSGSDFQFPSLSDRQAAQSAAVSYFDDPASVADTTIRLRPQDKYNEQAIPVPDTSAQDYVPDAITSPLDVPWSDTYVGSSGLPLALDEILTYIRANELSVAEEGNDTVPDGVTPIVAPFLPFQLPSFNFSLSGIWHYVREFVASIGSGFSLIRSTWSALPYAMVVPIYASLVCVIVIGLWRRFFE